MSVVALAEWHHTIVGVITAMAIITGIAKIVAFVYRWRDGNEPRRALFIIGCAICAYINFLRFMGESRYDPVALAYGASYIIIFMIGILWLAVYEIAYTRR